MSTAIKTFLEILSDNEFKPLYRDIPEDVPDRYEIIADIQDVLDDDGSLPDELRYYELNGKSNKAELKKYLEKSFLDFKTDFISNSYRNNTDLILELSNRVDMIISDFKNHVQEAMSLKRNDLVELYETKFQFLEEVKSFFNPKTDVNQNINKNERRTKPQYYFVVRKEYKNNFNDILQKIYKKLLTGGYIECTESEFKRLFYLETEIGERKTPKPVIWISKENRLAFFIRTLKKNLLIKSNTPPKWDSAATLFHNKKIGLLFKDIQKGERLKYEYNLNDENKELIEKIVRESIDDCK